MLKVTKFGGSSLADAGQASPASAVLPKPGETTTPPRRFTRDEPEGRRRPLLANEFEHARLRLQSAPFLQGCAILHDMPSGLPYLPLRRRPDGARTRLCPPERQKRARSNERSHERAPWKRATRQG